MILRSNCHEAIATRPIGDLHIDGWINRYKDEQLEVYRSVAPPTYLSMNKTGVDGRNWNAGDMDGHSDYTRRIVLHSYSSAGQGQNEIYSLILLVPDMGRDLQKAVVD